MAIHIAHVGNVQPSDLIAALALAVSVVALIRPWWVDWQRNARASFEVRNESLRRPAMSNDRVESIARYVIKNYGPAVAHSVHIEFRREGKPVQLIVIGGALLDQPLLHAGEEHHVRYSLVLGQKMPDCVVVSWRDRRLRRQTREFWPSLRVL